MACRSRARHVRPPAPRTRILEPSPHRASLAGFGGGNGVETVEERRSQLETWMNSVLHLCPMDKEILGFLAEDGRCAPQPHTAFSTAC